MGLAVSAHNDQTSIANSLRADRDEALQCLIQANLKLQEYDQDRTTFLARAVHDFRAPLTALSGYCGLLLGEPLGPLMESQREVLRRMQHSAKRLSRMADAMFQLSVGRHVKRQVDLQRSDIRECLEQALHEIMPFADDKAIAITADLAPADHPLYFEAGQIEQVLINILDNACKFTPRAGAIELRGYPHFFERRGTKSSLPLAVERRRGNQREPNTYRIDIRDSGNAIPAEHIDRIFEEYTSYAGGRDRSGGGLGLAISRMIITQHDGRVWAENTELGPMFSIVLPARRPQAVHTVDRLLETA
jgi:signal transduction histidine kinase